MFGLVISGFKLTVVCNPFKARNVLFVPNSRPRSINGMDRPFQST